MPVTQLEKLSDKPRNTRISLLLNHVDIHVLGMITFLAFLEYMLVLVFFILILAFIPVNLLERILTMDFFQISQGWEGILQNLFFYLSASLIAPFHVAAGFSIYVNRRAVLEGWDIELVFRRIATRHKKKQMAGQRLNDTLKKTTLLLIFFIFAFSWSYDVLAQQEQIGETLSDRKAIHDTNTAKQQIKEIIAGKEFHVEKEIAHYTFWKDLWAFISNLFEWDSSDSSSDFDLLKALASFFKWVAMSIELILWVLFLGLIVGIIYKYRSWFKELAGISLKKPDLTQPETLFGLDIREESLPDNVPDTVLNLWKKGEKRNALGLLYRSTLSNLVSKYSFIFNDSCTEQECINIVATGQQLELTDYFETLTNQWQLLAYGHQYPETSLIEILCQKWSSLFERRDSEFDAKQNQ